MPVSSRRAARSPRTAAARPIRPTRRSARDTGPPAGARASFTGIAVSEAGGNGSGSGAPALLEVRDLKKHFVLSKGLWQGMTGRGFAVDGGSFEIARGEPLGLSGESGCAKSAVARAILRLIEPTDGSIKLDGRDVTHLKKAQLGPFRRQMQIIFQDPSSSLDPRT